MGRRSGKTSSGEVGSGKVSRFKKLSAVYASVAAVIGGTAFMVNNLSSIKNSWSEIFSDDEMQLIVQLATEPYVNPDPEDTFVEEGQYRVSYQSVAENGELRVAYTSEYFDEKAKSVGILGSGPYFTLPKVGLDLKIVNNSKQTVFLSDAVLEVRSSVPDNRPLFAFTHHDGVIDAIQFTNDGWGEPTRVQMFARIPDQESNPLRELPYQSSRWENGVTGYYFDITPLLEPYGIPVDKIKQALSLMEKEGYEGYEKSLVFWRQVQPACMRRFGSEEDKNKTDEEFVSYPHNCTVKVAGHVLLTWQDSMQVESSRRIEFETTVFVTPPDEMGAPAFGPTGSYDIALKAEGKDYVVQKPISQPIEAGKFDRFILWLGAPQSSVHDFVLRLKFNNTRELSSQKIKVQYLMPRTNREVLDRAEADE